MSWWGLLIEVFVVWFLWIIASAAERSAEEARRGIPEDQRGGVSITPIIPVLPLAFWGTALLVDLAIAPWGTRAVSWFHGILGVLFIAIIARNVWRLSLLDDST